VRGRSPSGRAVGFFLALLQFLDFSGFHRIVAVDDVDGLQEVFVAVTVLAGMGVAHDVVNSLRQLIELSIVLILLLLEPRTEVLAAIVRSSHGVLAGRDACCLRIARAGRDFEGIEIMERCVWRRCWRPTIHTPLANHHVGITVHEFPLALKIVKVPITVLVLITKSWVGLDLYVVALIGWASVIM